MARRTKQRSLIDRRRRSSNLKRAAVISVLVLSMCGLYYYGSLFVERSGMNNAVIPAQTPSATQKGTVILLTTPTLSAALTQEVEYTPEATYEATAEPSTTGA